MTKTIAILIPDLTVGGVQRWALNLSEEFANQGYKVDLLVLKSAGLLTKYLSDKVSLVEIDSNRIRYSLFKIVKYLNTNKPDVFLSAQTDINILAIIAGIFSIRNPSIVVSQHSNFAKKFSRTWAQRMMRSLAIALYPMADAIVVVSRGIERELQSNLFSGRGKIKHIYNPIVRNDVDYLASKQANIPWGNRSSYKLIVAAGRFSEEKNFNSLIKAFGIVTKLVDSRLLLLGDGAMREELENLVEAENLINFVSLPGNIDNPFPIFKEADLFVLSSDFEALPMVIGEALAVGTTVVSTDCQYGPREILADGKFGRLVSVDNISKLAEGIMKSLKTPFDSNILKQRASEFSVKKSANEYISLFEHIAEQP